MDKWQSTIARLKGALESSDLDFTNELRTLLNKYVWLNDTAGLAATLSAAIVPDALPSTVRR